MSASRIAKALEVTPRTVKKVASPVGKMKMPYRNTFEVFDPELVETLRDDPEIKKGQERKRRGQANRGLHKKAAEKRRQKCIDHLAEKRPELRGLYERLVRTLWSPAQEDDLYDLAIYRGFPALLWDALLPKEEEKEEAEEVIANILWACSKTRTWKVNEFGDQDFPLSLKAWESGIPYYQNPEIYRNIFASAIRHQKFDWGYQKKQGRNRALEVLNRISSRDWPYDEDHHPR